MLKRSFHSPEAPESGIDWLLVKDTLNSHQSYIPAIAVFVSVRERRESVLSLEDKWWFEEKKGRAKNAVECACHEVQRLSKLFLATHKDSN